MAAVVTYPSRLGLDVNNTGAGDLSLFMQEFSGMVMTKFNEVNVFRPLHRVKTITSGESHTFEALGEASSAYHVPGQNILESTDGLGDASYLSEIAHARRTILTDPVEISAVFVDKWDEMVNHYDVRAEYARQLGEALSESYDRRLAQVLALAGDGAEVNIAGVTGASTKIVKAYVGATDTDKAKILYDAAFAAKDAFAVKRVPMSERYVAMSSAEISLLIKESATNSQLIDKDLSAGNGDVAGATMLRIAGFRIVQSEHLPTQPVSADPAARNTYDGDFTGLKAIFFHKSAIGSVQLKGISSTASWKDEYQGTLLMSKMCVGSGILRPECVVTLYDDNTP